MSYSSPTADFITTTLNGALAAGANSATIGTGLDLPVTNGILQVDYDDPLGAGVGADNGPETISYTTYTSGTGALTGVVRGLAGTTDVSHNNGATVQCGATSVIFQTDIKKIIEASAWTDWTPTLTNLSGGTLNYAKYIKIGKIVHFRFKYTLAGAGVAGGVSVSLPVASSVQAGGYIGMCELKDDNGFRYFAGAFQNNSVSSVGIHAQKSDGTYLLANDLSSTIPFTWAADDYIEIRGTYEAA